MVDEHSAAAVRSSTGSFRQWYCGFLQRAMRKPREGPRHAGLANDSACDGCTYAPTRCAGPYAAQRHDVPRPHAL